MNIRNPLPYLTAALAMLAGAAFGPAFGDTTFGFTVQDRAPEVPTSRVRIALELAAPPTGSSVTIGGMTANLGAGSQTLGNGDRFRLLAGPASIPNSVIFQYDPVGNLADPNELCVLQNPVPNAFPQAVTVAFSGPTISRYAMNSYGASRLLAASGIGDCTQSKRRLSNKTAQLTSPPPGATSMGRLPIDIVLVLDKSGSMILKPPGDPASPNNRYKLLANAVNKFVTIYEQVDTQVTGDRLGVVFFDAAASVVPETFSGSLLHPRNGPVVAADGPHAWDTVIKRVASNGPGSVTAMGTGLLKALDYKNVPGGTSDLAVILMTDGYQNDGPQVLKDPNTGEYTLNGVKLFSHGVPIFAIGLGTPSSVQPEVIDGMASQTAGKSQLRITGDGLDQAFADNLVAILKGNTLSLVARQAGVYEPPAAAAQIPVTLDGSISRATAVLGWKGRQGSFNLRWIDPSGATVTPAASKATDFFIVQSVDLPADGSKVGEWKLLVVPRDLGTPTPFTVDVFAGDTRLKYEVHASQPSTGAGDPLLLTAQISFDGKPLTGIAGGVRVGLARPGEGLGNILAGSKAAPTAQSTTGDVHSAYQQKLQSLEDTSGLLESISPKPVGAAVQLRDDGAGGDVAAGDGIYSAMLTNTGVPGTYVMDVVLEWNDSRTGSIRRLESIQRSVTVVPDAQATQVQILEPAADGSYLVKFTPRDRLGNFKGPGYESFIHVAVANGTLIGPVVDPETTGTYQVRIGNIPPGQQATTTIIVDGAKVRTNAPVKPGTTGGYGGRAVWVAFGSTFPHGSFRNDYKRDLAGTIAFEQAVSATAAVEATIGLHRFKGKNAAPDLDVTQFGVNGKWYFPQPGFKPFVTLGIGGYSFDPGSTRFGANAGIGIQVDVAPRWSVEGRYSFHAVSGNSPNSRYSTLQLGLRYAF